MRKHSLLPMLLPHCQLQGLLQLSPLRSKR